MSLCECVCMKSPTKMLNRARALSVISTKKVLRFIQVKPNKVFKNLFVALITLVLIGCVILSHLCLMVMAYLSGEIENPIAVCHKNAIHLSSNGSDATQVYSYEIDNSRGVWLVCLFLAIVWPYAKQIIHTASLWRFRDYGVPRSFADFAAVIVVETLPSVGLSLMVFVVMPQFDIIRLVLLQWSFYLFPAYLNIANSSYQSYSIDESYLNYGLWRRLAAYGCLFVQMLVVVVWAGIEFVDNRKASVWIIPVAVWLVSFSLWTNYVHRESSLKLIVRLARARDNLDQCGHELVQLFVSVWKISVTFMIMSVIMFTHDDIPIEFSTFENIFEYENLVKNVRIGNHTVFEEEEVTVESILPISVLLVQILATIISNHLCDRIGLKMPSRQLYTHFLALTLSPVIQFFTLFGLHFSHEDKCSQLEYFHWSALVNLNVIYDNVLMYALLPLSVIMFLSYLGVLWNTNWMWSQIKSTFRQKLVNTLLNVPPVVLKMPSNVINYRENKYTVYLCPTLWHEEDYEMEALISSLMDVYEEHKRLCLFYAIEAHFYIDDAFEENKSINAYVKNLADIINERNTKIEGKQPTVTKILTPYGQQIHFHLFNGYKMVAHLKDKHRIRKGKRWSQVMYMHLIKHYIEKTSLSPVNTFLVALDGDTNYPPSAIFTLIESAIIKPSVGAISGKLVPVSRQRFNLLIWYQMFEYTISYWFHKTTEVICGCVLCSPGCFTLYRLEAIFEVMDKFSTKSYNAFTQILYGQGEDRWLTTLLIRTGWQVDFSPLSVAYTYSPTTFEEFVKQRLRWISATVINNIHLILISAGITENSQSVSWFFIIYQTTIFLLSTTLPGLVIIVTGISFNKVLPFNELFYIALNSCVLMVYCGICLYTATRTQLLTTKIMAGFYVLALIMVFGTTVYDVANGVDSPILWIFLAACIVYMIAALMHPNEFFIILGFIPMTFACAPLMHMLLPIYSIINMDSVTWGTREKARTNDNEEASNMGSKSGELVLDEEDAKFWEALLAENSVLNPNQDGLDSEDKEKRMAMMKRQRNMFAITALVINVGIIIVVGATDYYLQSHPSNTAVNLYGYVLNIDLMFLIFFLISLSLVLHFISMIIHRYRTLWRYIGDNKLHQ